MRRVAGVLAHVEPVDDVVAAVLTDVVEHPREDAAVHQVPGDLDGLVDVHTGEATQPPRRHRRRPHRASAAWWRPGSRSRRGSRRRAGTPTSPASSSRVRRPAASPAARRTGRPTPACDAVRPWAAEEAPAG